MVGKQTINWIGWYDFLTFELQFFMAFILHNSCTTIAKQPITEEKIILSYVFAEKYDFEIGLS